MQVTPAPEKLPLASGYSGPGMYTIEVQCANCGVRSKVVVKCGHRRPKQAVCPHCECVAETAPAGRW